MSVLHLHMSHRLNLVVPTTILAMYARLYTLRSWYGSRVFLCGVNAIDILVRVGVLTILDIHAMNGWTENRLPISHPSNCWTEGRLPVSHPSNCWTENRLPVSRKLLDHSNLFCEVGSHEKPRTSRYPT